jgi:hypothetical protein
MLFSAITRSVLTSRNSRCYDTMAITGRYLTSRRSVGFPNIPRPLDNFGNELSTNLSFTPKLQRTRFLTHPRSRSNYFKITWKFRTKFHRTANWVRGIGLSDVALLLKHDVAVPIAKHSKGRPPLASPWTVID